MCQERSRRDPDSPHPGCHARDRRCGPALERRGGGWDPCRGTRAAKRHVVVYVKRYGIVLRTSDLDLQCSGSGRSRWKCFVYANGGQCTGTLSEAYSTRARTYRARNIDIACGE